MKIYFSGESVDSGKTEVIILDKRFSLKEKISVIFHIILGDEWTTLVESVRYIGLGEDLDIVERMLHVAMKRFSEGDYEGGYKQVSKVYKKITEEVE